jgi:hypothetical protein
MGLNFTTVYPKIITGHCNTCQLVMQEIVTELYLLRLIVFRFFESLSLDSISNKSGFYSRMILKGNLQHTIKGAGKMHLGGNRGQRSIELRANGNGSC